MSHSSASNRKQELYCGAELSYICSFSFSFDDIVLLEFVDFNYNEINVFYF